jgi:hypothetical protein
MSNSAQMKEDLESLSKEAFELIGQYASKMDSDAVGKLSTIASRAKRLQLTLNDLNKESVDLLNAVAQYRRGLKPGDFGVADFITNHDPEPVEKTRKPKSILRIEIDWAAIGKDMPREILCESKASDTLAKFLGRLSDELGAEILQKLTRLRINRGPLVSQNPSKDFVNGSSGELFSHQMIRGKGCYVLTNTSTLEKVKDVRTTCKFLGLPENFVNPSEVDFAQWRLSLYE